MSSRTTSPGPFGISPAAPAKGNISLALPQGPRHTAPAGASPGSASFMGFSPLPFLCQLPGQRNPPLGQEHWIQHAHCKREAGQQPTMSLGLCMPQRSATAPCQHSAGTLPLRAPPAHGTDSLRGFREIAGTESRRGVSSASLGTRRRPLGKRPPCCLGGLMLVSCWQASLAATAKSSEDAALWDLRGPTVSINLCPCFPRLPARKLMIPAHTLLAAPSADPPTSLAQSAHIKSTLPALSAPSNAGRSQWRADREDVLGRSCPAKVWQDRSLGKRVPQQTGLSS